MRRLTLALVILGLAAFPPALASAGGKPSREPLVLEQGVFPAGDACSFKLAVHTVVNKGVVKTFPARPNGDVLLIITGRLIERLTNVHTGTSTVIKSPGAAKITLHPDGSLTFVQMGRALLMFDPGDIPAGPATYLFIGRTVVDIPAGGPLILVSHHGSQRDLCAALS